MTLTEAQKRATLKYHKEKVKRIPLDVQIADFEEIKKYATNAGEPVNTYIKKAIKNRIQSDQAQMHSHREDTGHLSDKHPPELKLELK